MNLWQANVHVDGGTSYEKTYNALLSRANTNIQNAEANKRLLTKINETFVNNTSRNYHAKKALVYDGKIGQIAQPSGTLKFFKGDPTKKFKKERDNHQSDIIKHGAQIDQSLLPVPKNGLFRQHI